MFENDIEQICESLSNIFSPILSNKLKMAFIKGIKEGDFTNTDKLKLSSETFFQCFINLLRTKFAMEVSDLLEKKEFFENLYANKTNDEFFPECQEISNKCSNGSSPEIGKINRKKNALPSIKVINKIKDKAKQFRPMFITVKTYFMRYRKKIVGSDSDSSGNLSENDENCLRQETCHVLTDFLIIDKKIEWRYCSVQIRKQYPDHLLKICFPQDLKTLKFSIFLHKIKEIRQTTKYESGTDSVVVIQLFSGKEIFIGFGSFEDLKLWMLFIKD
ncbi:hypothetical protein HZS_7279 [Henneguya salminicola]|nr:hypothetical protein HZS_7279 [Henneguya salminicola]